MTTQPSLTDWLRMPAEELAGIISQYDLTVVFHNDGTRRYYQLQKRRQGFSPTLDDVRDYAEVNASAHTGVYASLYRLGVQRIVTLMIDSTVARRGSKYLTMAGELNRYLTLNDAFRALYDDWDVKARAFGDYDLAWPDQAVAARIAEDTSELARLRPQGTRGLFYGYYAGSFSAELITRTARFATEHAREPTEAEIKCVVLPDGLDTAHVLITGGLLRVGHILHPLLDAGETDIYVLAHLPLDIREDTIRRILYDHLFRRRATPTYVGYEDDDLAALDAFYQGNTGVVGLGQLVGPGLWHPNYSVT